MNKVTEDEIKEYLKSGGQLLLTIVKMDSYRDGGTKVIECGYASPIKFYIHKDNWTIHNDYPISEENEIKDDFLKRYLITEMKKYTQRLYDDVLRKENWINELENKYNQ